jgi:predicted transcriptional regulator
VKNVVSVRLDAVALRRVRELAKRDKKEISTVARELIEHGWVFVALREYRDGKLSLGSLAERLGVPLSDVIDLLADLGVRSPIEYDDYLQGYRAVSHLFQAVRKSALPKKTSRRR